MSKSDTFENDLMKLIFNGTAITGIADNASAAPSTVWYLSLHTADPGEAGSQATSEADYTGYTRVGIIRTSTAWTVSNNTAQNALLVQFPLSSGGSNIVTHIGVGVASTSNGKILYSGELTSPRTITSGIQPQFSAGDLIIEED